MKSALRNNISSRSSSLNIPLRKYVIEPFYKWLGKKYCMDQHDIQYEFERTNNMLRMLSECNQSVIRCSNEKDLLNNISSLIVEFGNYLSSVICYIDEQDDNFISPAAWYPSDINMLPKIKWKEETKHPFYFALKRKETIILNKYSDENGFTQISCLLPSVNFNTVIVLPLYFENKPLGILNIFSNRENEFKDDEIRLLQELSYDISYAITSLRIKEERTKTQEKLTEQHWLLRTLIDYIPDLIYVKDYRSKFLVANKKVAQIMGTEPEELIGKDDFEFYPVELAEQYSSDEKEMLITGKALISKEEPVIDPDGSLRYFSSTKVPFKDKRGNTVGLVGVGRDITEWKEAQIELHRINKMLRVLSECNQAILRCIKEDILLDDICRLIVDYGGYPVSWIGYLDENNVIKPVTQKGMDLNYFLLFKEKYTCDREFQNLFLGIIKEQKPGIFYNLENEVKCSSFRDDLINSGCESFIVLPLFFEKKPVGTLNIHCASNEKMKEDELDLLWEMANDLSHGITNLRVRHEREKAEDRLAEQLRLFYIFLDNMPDAMYVKDLESRFLVVNKMVAQVMGSTPENLIGKNDFDFYPYELAKLYYDDERNIMTSGESIINKEEIRINPDGNLKIILTTKVPFKDKDGNPVGIVGIGRDITEKKKLELTIVDNEQKLRAIVDGSPIPHFVIDSNHRVLYWNKALEEISGTKADTVIGTDQHWKSFYKTERPCLVDLLLDNVVNLNEWYSGKLKRSEIIPGAFEYEDFFPDLGIEGKWLYLTAAVIKDSNGNYIGAIETLEDISDRKRIEIEVINAKEQAEKSDRLKSEFLAQMSHEIRSPINTIFNFNELLKESLDLKNNDDQRQFFSAIEKAGERIVRTIDLILNMSEVQAGSYRCVYKEINLFNNILNKIFIEFQYKARKKNLDLNLHCPDKTLAVIADQYCLEQIIVNLIDNAIKYTQKGYIDITACKDEYNKVILKVIDTGIGIAGEYLSELFQPFSQEEQGYTRKFEGSGLGLALVKKYCEMNDAEISVESIKGKGTTFTVVFNKQNLG